MMSPSRFSAPFWKSLTSTLAGPGDDSTSSTSTDVSSSLSPVISGGNSRKSLSSSEEEEDATSPEKVMADPSDPNFFVLE